MLARTSTALFFALTMTLSAQQPFVSNLDEEKVGKLPIPDVLTGTDGKKIATKEDWLAKRRPELMKLFETEQYGKTPEGKPPGIRYVVTSEDKKALGGKATKREVTIFFTDKEEPHADMLVFIPNVRKQPAPMFVSLNFHGNQSVIKDPTIKLPMVWSRDKTTKAWTCTRAEESSRGDQADRWPVAEIIERGYGVATAYYCDFEPDTPEGLAKGVRPLYYQAGQTQPEPNEWGSIGAWAWGLSRMADYLQLLPEVDGNKLAVLGHSRLGKAALWAGAQDERFTIVISNDSGAGGAALSKRIFGETVERLNTNFPHWFNGNFKKYSDNEAALPVDQHELIALVAPRPIYIASATEDLWSDPKGEFLGGKLAEPVYALFEKTGLISPEPPDPDTSVGDFIAYHNRTGKHDILLFDWQCYMDFADRHWGNPE
jgi:hypothetical protein